MYLNCHTYYNLRYNTIRPKQLLAIASENGKQTLALTDLDSTSACLKSARLSSMYKIKPVLGIDFWNGVQQQFILTAKNNSGFQNIKTYLSKFLHNPELKIPEIAPELENVYAIYPYIHKRNYQLKHDEFLSIKPQDLNLLKFSKWNALRNKLVVLHTVSCQNKKELNSLRLLRAININNLLSKLPKSEQAQVTDILLPYEELCDIHIQFPELLENTASILNKCHVDFDHPQINPNDQPSYTHNEVLDLRLLKKMTHDGWHNRNKKPRERIYSRV